EPVTELEQPRGRRAWSAILDARRDPDGEWDLCRAARHAARAEQLGPRLVRAAIERNRHRHVDAPGDVRRRVAVLGHDDRPRGAGAARGAWRSRGGGGPGPRASEAPGGAGWPAAASRCAGACSPRGWPNPRPGGPPPARRGTPAPPERSRRSGSSPDALTVR